MINCIAFHSYKGGTGKTTIASNLSAFLAKKGYNVCLLDLDVYAPSLQIYFEQEPKRWINDYLYSDASIDDVMTDLSFVIHKDSNYNNDDGINKNENNNDNNNMGSYGKLLVAFSLTKKEEIYKFEGGSSELKKQLFRKLVSLREELISKYKPDYIIIDTSPGIRFWSLNALAIADVFFLTLKMGDIDIEGTKQMVNEIYDSFTKYGSKSFLVWNRVAGYCTPSHTVQTITSANKTQNNNDHNHSNFHLHISKEESSVLQTSHNVQMQIPPSSQYWETEIADTVSDDVGMKIISTIPCYCDIQFIKKEFLTAIQYSEHPFARKIEALANSMQEETMRSESS